MPLASSACQRSHRAVSVQFVAVLAQAGGGAEVDHLASVARRQAQGVS